MNESDIRKLVEQKIEEGDIFIVDIKIGKGNKIAIWVDKDQGITIEECVGISRYVENNLDRESEDFDLVVSSPGLDMPFKVQQQYEKNLNSIIEVVSIDGEKLKGKLMVVTENGIELEYVKFSGKNKKKKTENARRKYDFDQIKTTRAVIDFK